MPAGRMIQVVLGLCNRLSGGDGDDLGTIPPSATSSRTLGALLSPYRLQLAPDQDLSLALIPSPNPQDGLLVLRS